MEPHHPLKSAKTLQTTDNTGGKRRQLSFSHMWRMTSKGYANKMIPAEPREVSVASAVAEREATEDVGCWMVACKPGDSSWFPLC